LKLQFSKNKKRKKKIGSWKRRRRRRRNTNGRERREQESKEEENKEGNGGMSSAPPPIYAFSTLPLLVAHTHIFPCLFMSFASHLIFLLNLNHPFVNGFKPKPIHPSHII